MNQSLSVQGEAALHQPALGLAIPGNALGPAGSMGQRLAGLHRELMQDPLLSGVVRLAIALYNAGSNRVSTFINTSEGLDPAGRMSISLNDLPALAAIAMNAAPLVEDEIGGGDAAPADLADWSAMNRRLRAAGIRSRCTVPLYRDGVLVGFLFVSSCWSGYFTKPVLDALRPYWQLIATLMAAEVDRVRSLAAIVASADKMGRHTFLDTAIGESAGHMARVAEYADLIARDPGWDCGLDDETISYVRFYAPLHDIGKLAIPRQILAKPGELTTSERQVMKGHVACGVAMVDAMQRDFGPLGVPFFAVLRDVIGGHHETPDGTGYPFGLRGEAIRMESRIVAVADVFDALTSRRPYKTAWEDERAFDFLAERAGTSFDAGCVGALLRQKNRLAEIRERLPDGLPISALI